MSPLPLDHMLFIGALLVVLSVAITKLSDTLGIPALLLFLAMGMLAGSEGPGGIYFDNAAVAQSVGTVALAFILFAGGLDTHWSAVRPVVTQAAILSTVGVLLTTGAVGVFAWQVFDLPLPVGLLLGAVVSSTDAAAVFSVLRSKQVSLRGTVAPLLELESGSNDPMAVFLTIGMIQYITTPGTTLGTIGILFLQQMSLGAVCGILLGRALVAFVNRLNLYTEGIYPVFVIAFAALIYAGTAAIGGSGFLAVYLAGLVAGNSDFVQKKSLIRFFDGFAWLSQIAMFLTMGLLVFPSRIVPVVGMGMGIAAFLIFIARPVAVFLCLHGAGFGWREKTFVAWVGLRGAAPIILATFPLLARVPQAGMIFNVIFFVVLMSVLLQGWSIPQVARWLRLDRPMERRRSLLEFTPAPGSDTQLVDLIVPYNAAVVGSPLVSVGFPEESLVVLISRNDGFIVPRGNTILQEGDTLLVLANSRDLSVVRQLLSVTRPPER